MTENRTTELQGILDEFEHECFMLRVEASETRARDDVVRKSYERIRDEFAGRIADELNAEREKRLEKLVKQLWYLVNHRSGYGYAAALEAIEELGIEVDE